MIQKTLEETKKIVWPEIKRYLTDPSYPTQFQIPKSFNVDTKTFWNVNRVYPERKGKYLRPTLVLLISEALSGKISEKTLKTAAAMQLSEEWILIHDDIEDKSDIRRGLPSLHKLVGNELAINAGDSLHIIMWKIVSDIGSRIISDEFYKILLRTALGQGIEQAWTNDGKVQNEKEYLFIADSKSAYYSIAGPMRLGALVAKVNKEKVDKITNFGLHLGRCFQIIDDLLDYEQDKLEGKITLAHIKGVDYAKKLAEKEYQLAESIFNKDLSFLSHEPARTKLQELTKFIFERKY